MGLLVIVFIIEHTAWIAENRLAAFEIKQFPRPAFHSTLGNNQPRKFKSLDMLCQVKTLLNVEKPICHS